MDVLEEVRILTDAGGPGEFKYDGGPKPYVKKDGTTSEKSKKRVEETGGTEQPAQLPVPTEEQYAEANALVEKYYDEKLSFEEEKQKQRSFELSNHAQRIEGIRDQIEGGEFDQDAAERRSIVSWLGKFTTQGPITPEEDDALQEFVAGGVYQNQIQGFLISGKNPRTDKYALSDEQIKTHSEVLSKMTDKWSADKNLKLFRGVGSNETEGPKREFVDSLLESKSGDTLENKAFSSFSFSKYIGEQYSFLMAAGIPVEKSAKVTLQLNLKKGQHGVPVNDVFVTHNSTNREVVIDKNSRFKVESVDKEKRHVVLTLLDKGVATDSIALDYTFIPEEHPRQKDPDWGGKPQTGGEQKAPEQIPFPTGEQLDAANELVKKYYAVKENRPPGIEEGGTPQNQEQNTINSSWSHEEDAEIRKLFPGAFERYQQWLPIRHSREPEHQQAKERLSNERSAQHAIVEMWHNEFKNSPEGQVAESTRQAKWMKEFEAKESEKNKEKVKALKKKVPKDAQHFWSLYTGKKFSDEHKSDLYDFVKENAEFSGEDDPSQYNDVVKDLWKDASHFTSSRSLSSEEKEVVSKYQLGDEDMIFGIISGKETDETKKRSDLLSQAIHSQSISKKTTLFRGLKPFGESGDSEESRTLHGAIGDYLESLLSASPGDEIHNKSFAATSMEEDFAADWADLSSSYEQDRGILLKIDVEAGTPALNINSALGPELPTTPIGGTYIWQRETLLDKGSKFRVNRVDKENRTVHVSYIHRTQSATDAAPLPAVWIQGFKCFIETPKGQIRRGRGFAVRMPADYGFIDGFLGADGDEMDCYIGPNKWSSMVYVVDQSQIGSPTFDEHKCFLGFSSEAHAKINYLMGHHLGKQIFMGITAMSIGQFKHWLKFGNHSQPLSIRRAA